jgi:hypothetical protein
MGGVNCLIQKEAYFLKGNRLLIFLRHALCSMLCAVSCEREWAFCFFVERVSLGDNLKQRRVVRF